MEQAIRSALKTQFRASLETVRDAIQQCPDELWEKPGSMPQFWQIAYHTVFFAHFYMVQKMEDLEPWRKHRDGAPSLEPDSHPAYTKDEVLEYLNQVVEMVDDTLDSINLATKESGFHWYKIPKLDHEILNIRHIMEHAGQMDAILRLNGYEGVDWHS